MTPEESNICSKKRQKDTRPVSTGRIGYFTITVRSTIFELYGCNGV